MLMQLIRRLHMMITHQHKLLQLQHLHQLQHPLQLQLQLQLQLIMHQRLLLQQLTPMSLTQHQLSPKSVSG